MSVWLFSRVTASKYASNEHVPVLSVHTADVQPCGPGVCAAAVFATPFELWVFAFVFAVRPTSQA